MSAAAEEYRVTVLPAGRTFIVPAARTLLEAARGAGLELSSSCRNGTCRACMVRLVSGAIRHRIEWPGLSAEEKHDGWILPCVAEARSDCVIDTTPQK